MRKQQFIVKGEMTTLNEYIDLERGNRYGAARVKKAETERVAWEASVQKLGTVLDRVDLEFTWYLKNRRKDPDNVSFAQKFVLDGLVKVGVLPADSQKHVGSITHRFEIDKKDPRVEVVLT